MKNHFIKTAITLALLLINLFIQALPTAFAADLQYRKKEKDMTERTLKTIYFAGGCFWGIEKLFNSINGVIKAESGYANGNADIIPKYEKVIQGDTGFKETVKVDYAPAAVNLEQLLAAFFLVIDPTVKNRQANDIGTQYQTGIYYTEENSKQRIEEYIKHEKAKYSIFAVEVEQLQNFYPAEDYHQNYLNKNPHGYCHINPQIFKSINEKISLIKNNTTKFYKKTQQQLKKELTPLQFEVTQNAATERAFSGDYWNFFEKGIYVDITTGEPLFSSKDKFASSCGWPSFQQPINKDNIAYIEDKSYGMLRTKVKSKIGDSHLGHIFEEEPESPNGIRYCINSASIKFIPYKKMKELAYSDWLYLFE